MIGDDAVAMGWELKGVDVETWCSAAPGLLLLLQMLTEPK